MAPNIRLQNISVAPSLLGRVSSFSMSGLIRVVSHNSFLHPSASSASLGQAVEVVAGQASVRSSIANLVTITLGTGLLALPAAFADAGMVLGACFTLLCAGMGAFTLGLLAEMRHKVPPPASYASVSEAALPGFGALVTDILVASNGIGACITYQVSDVSAPHTVP